MTMADRSPTPKKLHPDEDLEGLSKADLIARVKEQDQYIKQLEAKRMKLDKIDDDFEASDRLKQQQKEAARRENTLVHRLTTKEQELQDYVNQIAELKHAQTQGTTQLKSMLLDPAVNIVFQRMAKEMEEAQEKLKQTQNELSAWKFTPDRCLSLDMENGQTGKRLMARCQMLLQENEELGKTIASGKTAKLEGEIALQKTLVTEMKNNQSELDEFLGDLEEDVEGMQTMIYVLQQQLRESKEQITALEEENSRLRSGDMSGSVTLSHKRADPKQEKSIKTENVNQNSYTGETDYTSMETRYYHEKTDSDLEAEYSYEGLYENEDKYQEELDQQRTGESEQYGYEENGYKNYDEDYDSQDYKSSYMETETEQESMETEDTQQTMSDERTRPPQLDNNSDHHFNPSLTSETNKDITNSSVQSTVDHSSPKSEDLSRQQLDDKQADTQDKLTVTEQDQTDVENGRKDALRTENCGKGKLDRERTPEKAGITKPSKISPKNKKSATKSKTSGNEDNYNKETRNGSPPKDHSPNNNYTKQLTVEAKERTDVSHTDSQSPNNRSPGSAGSPKEREPVLQKFLNGVTSTVDDIEDL